MNKMNIRNLLLIVLAMLCRIAYGQQIDTTYGRPLIVLLETDPWLMVIGSDVPSFVLYEKGQIIYKVIKRRKAKLYEATLSKDELSKVITMFSISDSIYALDDREIVISNATDQPSNNLYLNITQEKMISLYGYLDEESRKYAPKVFLSVYDKIKAYRSDSAKEWLPKKIELMFGDYDHAPKSRPWIIGFPDLNSSTTIKRDKDSYSVFIDKEQFEEFKAYYLKAKEKEAIEINGRKMAVYIRFPFPNIE